MPEDEPREIGTGKMKEDIHIAIRDNTLNVRDIVSHINSDATGAENIFVGKVRDHSNGQNIKKLEYSAYVPMAEKELLGIATEALNKFDIDKISIEHRIGLLQIGELAVVIAVSAKHRKDTFAATQYIIDTIKERVPIFKKEYTESGNFWVNSTP